MVASYTWHPGVKALGGKWVGVPAILPDETFSSWVVRTALNNGCDPLSLTSELWPDWRCWGADIDRGISNERKNLLSHICGVDTDVLQPVFLERYALVFNNNRLLPYGIWQWLLVIGARNRRRSIGLQYCPQCFLEDSLPYMRLNWRFAWHVRCALHKTELQNSCNRCGQIFLPHMLEAHAASVCICSSCGNNLAIKMAVSLDSDADLFQAMADSALKGNAVFLGKSVDPSEWFNAMHFLASTTYRIFKHNPKALMTFCKKIDIDTSIGSFSHEENIIEKMRACERIKIFQCLYKFCELTEEKLIDCLLASKVTMQSFVGDKEYIPLLLLPTVNSLTQNKKARRPKIVLSDQGPRSHSLVKSKMKALLKRVFEIKNERS
jgi:hypothetical protein